VHTEILGGTTEGVCSLGLVDLLRESKVGDTDVTLRVEQNVLGLEVAVSRRTEEMWCEHTTPTTPMSW